jgi:asparagine synthase (glutamine-hydrolysing)
MPAEKAKIEKELISKIYKTAENSISSQKEVGVSFSGGLDSSLLAKVCKDLRKDVKLLTIGFRNSSDIDYAGRAAKELDLLLFIKQLTFEELREDIENLAKIIDFPGVIDFEIALAFFIVLKFAAEKRIRTLLTASGLDAVFCGFDKAKRVWREKGEKGLLDLAELDLGRARENEERFDKIAKYFSMERINPFTAENFIEFALQIPVKYKIKNENDQIRKHILREAALKVGVPKSAALRAKKAIQYSSKIDSMIEKLARDSGISKKTAWEKGYRGAKETYLEEVYKSK